MRELGCESEVTKVGYESEVGCESKVRGWSVRVGYESGM